MRHTSRNVVLLFMLLAAVPFTAKPLPQDEAFFTPGSGVSEPVMVKNVQPVYTPEAREARIRGTIQLEAVVGTDGSVSRIQVVKGLGYGLDENAVSALSQWTFRPGAKDGKPVNVKIQVLMNFSLRD